MQKTTSARSSSESDDIAMMDRKKLSDKIQELQNQLAAKNPVDSTLAIPSTSEPKGFTWCDETTETDVAVRKAQLGLALDAAEKYDDQLLLDMKVANNSLKALKQSGTKIEKEIKFWQGQNSKPAIMKSRASQDTNARAIIMTEKQIADMKSCLKDHRVQVKIYGVGSPRASQLLLVHIRLSFDQTISL